MRKGASFVTRQGTVISYEDAKRASSRYTSGRPRVSGDSRVRASEQPRNARETAPRPKAQEAGARVKPDRQPELRARAGRADAAAARTTRTGVARGTVRFALRNKVNALLQRPVLVTLCTFFALVLAVGVFLYPTARTYYQAYREYDKVQAEFTAVVDRNTALAEEIEFLQTDEGIRQEARERLGWVERGENAVIVYGLDRDSASDVNADVVSGSVAGTDTWYFRVLDVIFGVK